MSALRAVYRVEEFGTPDSDETSDWRNREGSQMTRAKGAAVLACVGVLVLTGCGAKSSSATTTSGESTPIASPTCSAIEDMQVSWANDAQGAESVEDAAAPYVPEGATLKRIEGNEGAVSLMAESDDGTARALIDVVRISAKSGWVVNSVATCDE